MSCVELSSWTATFADRSVWPERLTTAPVVYSFSLYGKSYKYRVGVLRNLRRLRKWRPDWQAVIFLGNSISPTWQRLLTRVGNASLVCMKQFPEDPSAMVWRFLAAGLPPTTAVCVRDADSIISFREISAVECWLASSKALHIMRDHENHNHPMLGGMWGVRGSVGHPVFERVLGTCHERYFGWDMEFLAEHIYPHVAADALVHQDRPYYHLSPGQEAEVFPEKGRRNRFVGQGFSAFGLVRRGHDRSRVMKAIRQIKSLHAPRRQQP